MKTILMLLIVGLCLAVPSMGFSTERNLAPNEVEIFTDFDHDFNIVISSEKDTVNGVKCETEISNVGKALFAESYFGINSNFNLTLPAADLSANRTKVLIHTKCNLIKPIYFDEYAGGINLKTSILQS